MLNTNLLLTSDLDAHIALANHMRALLPTIKQIGEACVLTLQQHGKLLLCGNGGSAADCQHIAAELVGRFVTEREGLPAIALTTDSSILTAVANDYGYAEVFARQVHALANTGDLLLAYSTSGNSENVIKAVHAAKTKGCKVVGLLGKSGGQLNALCDWSLVVPHEETALIQEMHLMVGHMLCHMIDEAFKS